MTTDVIIVPVSGNGDDRLVDQIGEPASHAAQSHPGVHDQVMVSPLDVPDIAASPARPVVLRHGAEVDDPLTVVLGFLESPGRFDVSDPARPASFGELDLRLADRAGARISAAQIAAILQRRPDPRPADLVRPGRGLTGPPLRPAQPPHHHTHPDARPGDSAFWWHPRGRIQVLPVGVPAARTMMRV